MSSSFPTGDYIFQDCWNHQPVMYGRYLQFTVGFWNGDRLVALWIVSITSKMNDFTIFHKIHHSMVNDGSMIKVWWIWWIWWINDRSQLFMVAIHIWRLFDAFWSNFLTVTRIKSLVLMMIQFVRLPPHSGLWHSWFIVFLQAILWISPTLRSLPSSRFFGFNLPMTKNPAAVWWLNPSVSWFLQQRYPNVVMLKN